MATLAIAAPTAHAAGGPLLSGYAPPGASEEILLGPGAGAPPAPAGASGAAALSGAPGLAAGQVATPAAPRAVAPRSHRGGRSALRATDARRRVRPGPTPGLRTVRATVGTGIGVGSGEIALLAVLVAGLGAFAALATHARRR